MDPRCASRALLVIRLRLLTNLLVLLLPAVGYVLLLPAVGYALVLPAVGYALCLACCWLCSCLACCWLCSSLACYWPCSCLVCCLPCSFASFFQHFSSVHTRNLSSEYRHPSSIAILWLHAVFGNLALPLSLTSFHHWLFWL